MTSERLRDLLGAVREEESRWAAQEGCAGPAPRRGQMAAQLLAQRLTADGVTGVHVWREALFSPAGALVRTLNVLLTWHTGQQLELSLPDLPELDILLTAPPGASAPGNLHLSLDLDGAENARWSALRAWGEVLLPDPWPEG